MDKKSIGKPVSDNPDSQNPDEPYDITSRKDVRAEGGLKIAGLGAQGGGSKPTPQASIMKRGSGSLHGSYPKNPQRLRG